MEAREEITITEDDVIDVLDIFTRVPYLMLRGVVKTNKNVVKTFENKINTYNQGLSDYERKKIRVVCDMPVSELQIILGKAYDQTNKKQLKLLADPKAQNFIENNMNELKIILF